MDLIRSGPTPAKYSAGRVDNDWSSRHVRLRFEMVTASIIFYLVANHGVKVIDLPFVNLPDDFNPNLLYGLSLAFSLFAIISFVTRSQYERALWPKQELIASKEIDRLEKEYQRLPANLSSIKIDEEIFDEFLRKLIDKKDALRSFDYSISAFALTIDDMHSENGVNSPVHPKFWHKIVSLLDEAKKHSSALLSRATGIEFEHGEFASQSYRLEAIPENYLENYEGLSQTLSKITPEISERVGALKKHSLVRRFQTTILSIWIPGGLSVIAVILGIYSLLGAK